MSENDSNQINISVVISTKGRYFSTLPLTLLSITNQTYIPKELLIYDDNDNPIDLRNNYLYQYLFILLDKKGCEYRVIFGEKKGQVLNHIKSLKDSKYPIIWRIDDDEIAESNVLETLINIMFDNKDVGAVGGLILDPKSNYYKLPILASNRIEDINLGLNIQWFLHKDNNIKEVDHLYSSFIYRKDLAEYCSNLSQVCHREETIMTYNLKRKGYKLLVNPNCITWHFRFPEGGIRDNSRKEDFDHDELIFKNKLIEWGIKPTKYKEFVLDSGLGDHIIFKSLLPLIYEKYKDYKIVLYVCYPLVFEKENVIIDSIANAYLKFGNLDKFNLYKFMADINHKTHLKDAYIKLYNL